MGSAKCCDCRFQGVIDDFPFLTVFGTDLEEKMKMGVNWAGEHDVVSVGEDADVDVVDYGAQVAGNTFFEQFINVEVEEEGRMNAALFDATMNIEGRGRFFKNE